MKLCKHDLEEVRQCKALQKKLSEEQWQQYCLKQLEKYLESNKDVFERLKNK